MSTWTDTVDYIKSQLRPGVLGNTDVQKILNSVLAVVNQITAGYVDPSTALWDAETSYAQDTAPVLWQDQWLVSNIPNNTGNVPINTSGVVHPSWRVISSSPGSGIADWSAGVYPNSLEIVFVAGSLYYLDRNEVGADPFVSSDFANELAANQWVTLTGGGGSGGMVNAVVAGTGIEVNASDPANPIVALSAAAVFSLARADEAHGWGNHANAGYLTDAPGTGGPYARQAGAWVTVTPFAPGGTPTDGQVVTWQGGSPVWADAAGGSGGSSPWTVSANFIHRDSPVQVGKATATDGGNTNNVTFLVQSKFDNSTYEMIQFLALDGTKRFYMRDSGLSFFENGVGYGTEGLVNARAIYKSETDTSGSIAVRALNASGETLFTVDGNQTKFHTNPVGFHRNSLSNFTIAVQSNNAGGGSIIIYNQAGSLRADFDNDANFKTLAGAYFGRRQKPNGAQQVVIRGKGTGTGRNLELEDSGGTKNAYFYDDGNIEFLRLPTSISGSNRLYVYDDGSRKYVCIS